MRRWQSGRLRVTVNHVVKRGGSNPSQRTRVSLVIETWRARREKITSVSVWVITDYSPRLLWSYRMAPL